MNVLENEKKYCSQGDTSGKHNPKKVFIKAEGCYLYDENGTKYLDMQMFNSAANFGYQKEEYNNCINDSINSLPALAGEFMSESRIELSKEICEYMFNNYGVKGRVHFTVGGAQAVDDALKLATNYNSKNNFFSFEGSYHGRTMASSSVSSSYRYTKQFGSVLNTMRLPFPNCYSCVYGKNKNTCDLFCLKQFKRLFESEFSGVYDTNSKTSAYSAFIFEPVLGRGGYVFPNADYLSKLTEFLHKYNILVIADEVQMGFYRTGKLWSFEHYGFIPDIIIFGKAITNGLWPLSGVWAKEEIITPDLWPTGSTHCTFAGHPLGTSLGLCTFKIIQVKSFVQKINESSCNFKNILMKIKKDYDCIGRVQVKGHAAGIDIIHPLSKTPFPELAHKLTQVALEKTMKIDGKDMGMILTYGGMFNSQLMLSPCLYIDKKSLSVFDELFRYYLDLAISQLEI